MWVRSCQEDPLEEGMVSHASSSSAWRIPRTEGPGGLRRGGKESTRLKQLSTLAQKKEGCSTLHILYIP